ncbi:helix-turn-helix domain-containing protein [Macrococcus capreoli]|uniref:helix-turn-helix domain-containing protein n=1 Tax=Macrococcus capreoli TaxID=2982690 RepID=UPI003EE81F0E
MFGEKLNNLREYLGISINKLGEAANISPTYISRIQNNPAKKPSKKLFLKLTYVFLEKGMLNKIETSPKFQELYFEYIRSFVTDNEKLTEDEARQVELLNEEATAYFKKTLEEVSSQIFNLRENFYKNLFLIQTNDHDIKSFKNFDMNNLQDKPIFDLKWLLNQEKYEVFYGRDRLLHNSKKNISIDYNVLSKEDKELIFNLIEAYLKTKYMRLDEPEKFFDNIFRNTFKQKED